jgi:hypothetical protein
MLLSMKAILNTLTLIFRTKKTTVKIQAVIADRLSNSAGES